MLSLKASLEQQISNAIYAFAAAASPTVDTDLDADERLATSKGGVLPYDQELATGPLIRVMIERLTNDGNEFGSVDTFASTIAYSISIVGVTHAYADQVSASQACSKLEEIIRLHLQNLDFDIEAVYSAGRLTYAAMLLYQAAMFETISLPGRQIAPFVEPPVAVSGNSNAVIVSVDPNHAYSGSTDSLYTVELTAANNAATDLTGLAFKYKQDAGAFSTPQLAIVGPNQLNNELYLIFTPAAVATVGDSWTIQTHAPNLNWIGIFNASYLMRAEAYAVQ